MIHLSKRELQVLNLIAFEHKPNEIAKKLSISGQAARSHRKILLKKLDARNVAGLVRRAFELSLLDITNLKPEIPSVIARSGLNKNSRYHPEMAGKRIQNSNLTIVN